MAEEQSAGELGRTKDEEVSTGWRAEKYKDDEPKKGPGRGVAVDPEG